MPPVFYIEVRNRAQDFSNQTPLGLERILVTRYYTEFNPSSPDNVLERLSKPEWSGIESSKLRTVGIRPRSIVIEPGDWDRRIDWREEWEEIDETTLAHTRILGLDLYNTRTTVDLGADRVAELTLSSEVWGTDVENAAHFQKLGRRKKTTTITGKAIGEVSYPDLYDQILLDRNIVELSLNYSKDTNTTAVSIKMEDSSDA